MRSCGSSLSHLFDEADAFDLQHRPGAARLRGPRAIAAGAAVGVGAVEVAELQLAGLEHRERGVVGHA